jgi:hypothetical protein
VYSLVLGLAFGYYCFGTQMLSPLFFILTGYALLVVVPGKAVALTTFVFAILYMSVRYTLSVFCYTCRRSSLTC